MFGIEPRADASIRPYKPHCILLDLQENFWILQEFSCFFVACPLAKMWDFW